MPKRPFKRQQKRKQHGATFWDKEYANPGNLKLSTNQSEDLEKFTRWLQRETGRSVLSQGHSVVDVGCGNGRNLIFLAREFAMKGVGYDVSAAAIAQARAAAGDLPLTFETLKIKGSLPLADASQILALDMMTSHFLNAEERTLLREELFRTLAPGGYLFMKTFLKDGDLHTKRLIEEAPGPEPGTYVHPVIGVPEFVYSEDELLDFLGERFTIHKLYRSHKHVSKGKARKRRTISIYAQKPEF